MKKKRELYVCIYVLYKIIKNKWVEIAETARKFHGDKGSRDSNCSGIII